jgi:hypothetical protein
MTEMTLAFGSRSSGSSGVRTQPLYSGKVVSSQELGLKIPFFFYLQTNKFHCVQNAATLIFDELRVTPTITRYCKHARINFMQRKFSEILFLQTDPLLAATTGMN